MKLPQPFETIQSRGNAMYDAVEQRCSGMLLMYIGQLTCDLPYETLRGQTDNMEASVKAEISAVHLSLREGLEGPDLKDGAALVLATDMRILRDLENQRKVRDFTAVSWYEQPGAQSKPVGEYAIAAGSKDIISSNNMNLWYLTYKARKAVHLAEAGILDKAGQEH